MTQLKVRRLVEGAKIPAYATPGSNGFDLHALLAGYLEPGERVLVPTGLAVELPPGFAMLITPRSGLAFKHGVTVLNAPGLIDSDYRGGVAVILHNAGQEPFTWAAGDRIAQAVPMPIPQLEIAEVDELSETERGENGMGSTGVAA